MRIWHDYRNYFPHEYILWFFFSSKPKSCLKIKALKYTVRDEGEDSLYFSNFQGWLYKAKTVGP